jgi:hypothetical protein
MISDSSLPALATLFAGIRRDLEMPRTFSIGLRRLSGVSQGDPTRVRSRCNGRGSRNRGTMRIDWLPRPLSGKAPRAVHASHVKILLQSTFTNGTYGATVRYRRTTRRRAGMRTGERGVSNLRCVCGVPPQTWPGHGPPHELTTTKRAPSSWSNQPNTVCSCCRAPIPRAGWSCGVAHDGLPGWQKTRDDREAETSRGRFQKN